MDDPSRSFSVTSKSTVPVWHLYWICVRCFCTTVTPVPQMQNVTPSSKQPVALIAAGGASVPCPWKGDSSKMSRWLWDTKSALLVDWKQYVSIRFIILCPSFRVEETWRLWQKFLDDFAHFEEWLATSEKAAAQPNSSGVLYTVAKEELKKFEVLQKSFLFIINCWTAINEARFYVDFPEASPRKPNPVRVNQQAIPPPGQRKPHWLLLSSEGNGSQCQPAMGQPPEEGGLNPPQAQSTINSFSLYSNGRCACLTESTSPHTLQPYVPFVVTATVRAACLFHFYSTLLIRERSLRLPEMVFWCGWQRWTCSWPTSSISQSVTFRPKLNNSGWVCHILIRDLFWPWKQN